MYKLAMRYPTIYVLVYLKYSDQLIVIEVSITATWHTSCQGELILITVPLPRVGGEMVSWSRFD